VAFGLNLVLFEDWNHSLTSPLGLTIKFPSADLKSLVDPYNCDHKLLLKNLCGMSYDMFAGSFQGMVKLMRRNSTGL
jgi:hypothetical protein